jgi:4-hydroxybenzoate polyprenyltransferase
MKKLFKPFIDFILFSNVFMALCGVAQALLTFHMISSRPVYAVLGILFTATLAEYNFSILISKPKQPEKSVHARVRWFFAHHRLMVTFTIVSVLALIPLFLLISFESRILLIFMGVLCVGYSVPLFTIGDHKFGLRHVPGLKPFLITLVWTLSCVLLPVLEAQDMHLTDINMRDTTILIAKRFLFIGALTIPFDIRDLFYDKQTGLKTIPVAWGEKNAYLFCQILLAGYLVLLFMFRNRGFNIEYFALAVTTILTGWLIFKSKWEKNEYYYFLYMDGVLILQYVVVVIFDLLFK